MCIRDRLRTQGIKTVHFVCPSIWAWRAHRVEKIRASADHVLCLFPFEPELLARHGIAATYVAVSYTHLRAHETVLDLVCRLLLEKKK